LANLIYILTLCFRYDPILVEEKMKLVRGYWGAVPLHCIFKPITHNQKMSTLSLRGPASDMEAISYGLLGSFGFVLMFFMYHYCKFYTHGRPIGADTQIEAGFLETVYAIPLMKRFLDYWDPEPSVAAAAEETETDLKKPAAAAHDPEPFLTARPIILYARGKIVPLQPRRSHSAPVFSVGATALSPIREDGSFFFDDLPSPASAP
jgi:hypothetical protein